MKSFILHRDLHIDPMTNLKNFIQFIEEDYNRLFGHTGIVCIFDIARLRDINDQLGRDVGDLVIRTAAHVVCQYFNRDIVFRTEGDAFTIVMRNHSGEGLLELMDEVNNHYQQLMREKGYENFTLHHIMYTYDEPIESIEDYYMFVVKKDGEHDISRKFTGDQLVRHILSGVVNRFRQSLEYYEEVYNYALIDEISGLPNAKAANQFLGKMTTNVGRNTDKYTILFIDGDDLRRYNDISYEAGNHMIKRLGTIIIDAIREDDKIFRWLSGDEFIVVLQNTDDQTGELLAERIRNCVEDHQDEFQFKTTISIGVANYPLDGRDVDTVIYYAEKANKLAKERGKNQVISWREVDVAQL